MALALATTAQEPPHFEIDVIFPRNETYKPSSAFPIAIAVQNLTAIGVIGNFTLSWEIMPYTNGDIPSGLEYGRGDFVLPNKAQGVTIFVDTNNVTDWIHLKRRGERYRLQWSVDWDGLLVRCGYEQSVVFGGIMFGIEAEWDSGVGGEDAGKGKVPDILQVPECPVLGSVVAIRPNITTPTCPLVMDGDSGRQGNPCAVKVDKTVARSISSHVSSLATAPPTTTRNYTLGPPSTGGVGIAHPLQTALAAACLFLL